MIRQTIGQAAIGLDAALAAVIGAVSVFAVRWLSDRTARIGEAEAKRKRDRDDELRRQDAETAAVLVKHTADAAAALIDKAAQIEAATKAQDAKLESIETKVDGTAAINAQMMQDLRAYIVELVKQASPEAVEVAGPSPETQGGVEDKRPPAKRPPRKAVNGKKKPTT